MKLIPYILAAGMILPVWSQNSSSFSVTGKQGEEAVEIRNVTFELAGKTVLRKTEWTKQVIGDKGMEASTVVEAWPLGVDRKEKPKYTVKVSGTDARSMDDALLLVSRGLDDVPWWTVYRLSNGQPLFNTFVQPVRIPESPLYAGYEMPADGDPRLKNQRLVGIVVMGGVEGPVRRVELHASDPKRARILRSMADVYPKLEFNMAKKVLVLTLQNGEPDARVEIPVNGPAVIRCCDIVAR